MIATASYIILDFLRDEPMGTEELVRVVPASIQGKVTEEDVFAALGMLATRGWIEQRDAKWYATPIVPAAVPTIEALVKHLDLPDEQWPTGSYYVGARSHKEPWFAGVSGFISQLRRNGYEILRANPAAPLEIEGQLPSGARVTFRWEYGVARLDVIIPEWVAFTKDETTWNWAGSAGYPEDKAWDISVAASAFRQLMDRYIADYPAEATSPPM
jgi:hypothetical protein